MTFTKLIRAAAIAGLALASPLIFAADQPQPEVRGTFRYATTATYFDVSPPLRSIPIIPSPDVEGSGFFGSLMADPDPPGKLTYGEQDRDGNVQDWIGPPLDIPAPAQNFNVGTGTANPPDPVGDVSATHYVRMSNATFQIFNKTGTSQFGPAAINTLFVGFSGPCEVENAGDPIVLYDQLADRWLLTQFSDGNGPGFFLCVAISTSPDPLGTYFRYAFQTAVFPDYPKFGVWPNAYVMSTRELGSNSIGAYAVDRAQMIAGNPTPTIISFVNQMTAETARFLGDGLLPADLDGTTPPPAGSPAYFVGSMDNGGPYGATFDALFVWKFNINFANPPASTFVLAPPIPIAPYDTIYPCTGRSCIPQPAPLGAVDILSYRQRPMHRAAYRNYGSYESIVTNQSVEATPLHAGIRWWELRNLSAATPVLYQDSTFAPADGVQRWMGSIAQDRSGNMAMGYSVGGTTEFPGIRYTGRLESDPLGTMAQGEGTFVAGTGGSSQTTRRWGDYTSMNVDSADDCTFWYINEFFAVTGTQWTLRAGSFKFPDCGTPSFGMAAVPLQQKVCTPNNASITVDAHGYSNFVGTATLIASGQPAGTNVAFSPASITAVPGSSTLTLSNTAAVTAGTYNITVTGTGGAPPIGRSRTVAVDFVTATPSAPGLTGPANDLTNATLSPLFTWSASTGVESYVVEIASDAAFSTIVHTSPALSGVSYQMPSGVLVFSSRYFWRVRATNVCGTVTSSTVRNFITRPRVGQCAAGSSLTTLYFDNMENGVNGWTTDPVAGTTWTQSTARPFSGARSWLAVDVVTASDQRLTSPVIALPTGQQLLTLRFKHDVSMEPNAPGCFDGGFVEISTNAGATWTPIPAARVLQDFYDGALGNGTQAWCGTQPYTTASLDIDSFAGQNAQFRFRAITDTSVGFAPHGWYVDDVSVVSCAASDRLFIDSFEEL